MRVSETVVIGARLGGRAESTRIVKAYEGSLFSLALVLGIPESTARSRLQEIRRKLRAAGNSRPDHDIATTLRPFRIPYGLGERIMENVETLRQGAFIVERLAVQARLGEAFDEGTLAALGRVEGGAKFVRRAGTILGIKDLASILNCTDRYTEIRIIEGLEAFDPETSEALWRSLFALEDFVLFDSGAFGLRGLVPRG